MPVLEAMASAVPVVTTDCLGVRTFCRHGENCLIAAPDDAAGGVKSKCNNIGVLLFVVITVCVTITLIIIHAAGEVYD